MARICPSCGTEGRDDDRYCGRCGTSLGGASAATGPPDAFCTSCGSPLAAGDRFCGRCGAAAARVAAAGAEESFDPGDFFSEWNGRGDVPDEAKTEQVPVQTLRKSDTAVLPQIAPDAPADERSRPAPPPPDRRHRGFPLGATIAFLGGVAVVASSALPWLGTDDLVLPRDVPVSALLFGGPAGRGPSLGLVLLGLGMTGALVALLTMAVPALRFLRRIVGAVTLAAPALFVVRVALATADVGSLLDVLRAGIYLTAGGGLVQLLAGRWFRR